MPAAYAVLWATDTRLRRSTLRPTTTTTATDEVADLVAQHGGAGAHRNDGEEGDVAAGGEPAGHDHGGLTRKHHPEKDGRGPEGRERDDDVDRPAVQRQDGGDYRGEDADRDAGPVCGRWLWLVMRKTVIRGGTRPDGVCAYVGADLTRAQSFSELDPSVFDLCSVFDECSSLTSSRRTELPY